MRPGWYGYSPEPPRPPGVCGVAGANTSPITRRREAHHPTTLGDRPGRLTDAYTRVLEHVQPYMLTPLTRARLNTYARGVEGARDRQRYVLTPADPGAPEHLWGRRWKCVSEQGPRRPARRTRPRASRRPRASSSPSDPNAGGGGGYARRLPPLSLEAHLRRSRTRAAKPRRIQAQFVSARKDARKDRLHLRRAAARLVAARCGLWQWDLRPLARSRLGLGRGSRIGQG